MTLMSTMSMPKDWAASRGLGSASEAVSPPGLGLDHAPTRCIVVLSCEDLWTADQLRHGIEHAGHTVLIANGVQDIAARCEASRPDLVLICRQSGPGTVRDCMTLHEMLTDGDGGGRPLIVAASRQMSAEDAMQCLGHVDHALFGAMFADVDVALAQLRAIIRRTCGQATARGVDADPTDDHIRVGTITVRPACYEVHVNHQAVALSLAQFRLLTTMARRPGRTFTPEQLRQSLDRDLPVGEGGSIKSLIYTLRRRLGQPAAQQVQTVRGVGYRVVENDSSR